MGGYHGGKTLQERFDEKWDAVGDCRIWRFTKGAGNHRRANTFSLNGKVMNAHKAAWFMANGDIPSGMQVLHRCTDSRCVNADHLYLGTASDNTQDIIAAGSRGLPIGHHHPFAKLTDDDVRYIRATHAAGKRGTLSFLARQYGMAHSSVQDIILRKTWKHVA